MAGRDPGGEENEAEMSGQRTSHEIWREHARSVTFLLERAETEGCRASGTFGPGVEQLIGTATVLRLILRRCDADKEHHPSHDYEFDAPRSARVAYRFVWVQGAGARGEIELDAAMAPIWPPVARLRYDDAAEPTTAATRRTALAPMET